MPGTTRIAAARVLLVLAAVAAAVAALSAWPVVASAGPQAEVAEFWRMVGFATFAALFGLLARRPATSLGLWLVVIANKALLTVGSATVLAAADGAAASRMWDGALTVVLVGAFVLARPWRGEAGGDARNGLARPVAA